MAHSPDKTAQDFCNPWPSRPTTRNLCSALAVCGFLLLAVWLVFGQTIRHEFFNLDDRDYVYENPRVAHGLTIHGIGLAFTTTCGGLWAPLTWSSYLLDSQLYGLKPGGYHFTNVLLHAATAILLFLVLWRMTGDLWPSAFVAAVFAIHPLRVESVAWVAERKDVLSGLFFMLTLWAYFSFVRRPFSLVRYLTVIALFALGLMAKPMLVTLPLLLLLLDYWPLGRFDTMLLRSIAPNSVMENHGLPLGATDGRSFMANAGFLVLEKVPLLMLAVLSCVVTVMAERPLIAETKYLPLSARISNALVSYVAYLVFVAEGVFWAGRHAVMTGSSWAVGFDDDTLAG